MKILQVNNFYNNDGGTEKVFKNTGELLEKKGEKVYYFATNKGPFYIDDYEYIKYFPGYISYAKPSILKVPFYLFRSIYNIEAEKQLFNMISDVKPDLVHVHNIAYSLSPSVINACKKSNIPVVMTLHNPYLMCPAVRLMISNEKYCTGELCVPGNPIHCVVNKCYSKSFAKSTAATLEYLARRYFNWFDYVSCFISPSNALIDLAVKSGISHDKLVLINNFIEDSYFEKKTDFTNEGYFLYAGRLSEEKGLDSLLTAFSMLSDSIELHIAGTGNQMSILKQLANDLNAKNTVFKGYLTSEALAKEYKNCISAILPTVGFETFGLSVVEAFSFGKPVIGSNIGGIPEIIDNNVNGLIFEPGNNEQLANSIEKLYNNPDLVVKMGKNARQKAINNYSSEIYYSRLIDVYNSVLKR